MKKTLMITALVGLFTTSNYAQQDFQLQGQSLYTYGINKKSEAQGSKYLTEGFLEAKIDDSVKDFPLRFNAFENKFEHKNDSGQVIVLDNVYNKIAFSTGLTFELITYTNLENNVNKEYLELINLSSRNLFKTNKITFIDAKAPVNGYDTAKPAKYVPGKSSYIVKYGDKYFELPKKTKELEKMFPEKSEELKSFVKTNKTKLDKESDLIKLAQFLNK
nr:hypothetical protein [uncultured Flavobacterium sp.]